MSVLFFIIFVIFVVCGIASSVMLKKMEDVLQEENIQTSFSDRWIFQSNLTNKFLSLVHTCPDHDKKTEYMKILRIYRLCVYIPWALFGMIIILFVLLHSK